MSVGKIVQCTERMQRKLIFSSPAVLLRENRRWAVSSLQQLNKRSNLENKMSSKRQKSTVKRTWMHTLNLPLGTDLI